jgi:hypothetical protein
MGTDKIIHADLSEAVIGAAMPVLNSWQPGLHPWPSVPSVVNFLHSSLS